MAGLKRLKRVLVLQRPAVPGEGEPVQGPLQGNLRGEGPAGEGEGGHQVSSPFNLTMFLHQLRYCFTNLETS